MFTMKVHFVLLLAAISKSVSFYMNLVSVSDPICENIILFYDEIGCKPIGSSNNSITCATNFECPDYQKLDKNKCYYQGKYLNSGEQIYFNEMCFRCQKRLNNVAQFERCTRRCYGWGLSTPTPTLQKCYLDGVTHDLNSYMRPNGYHCLRCLCAENFDNSTSILENSDCKRVHCSPQVKKLGYLLRGCAPVFEEPKVCCVLGYYKCPHLNDIIDPASIVNKPTDGAFCKFGNLTLLRGEILKSGNKQDGLGRAICKCIMPPMITCYYRPR